MKYEYILYDGRAMYQDTDDCSVLVACGPEFTKSDFRDWRDYDAVLVRYQAGPNHTLTNEWIIGPLSLGFKTLKSMIKEGP